MHEHDVDGNVQHISAKR